MKLICLTGSQGLPPGTPQSSSGVGKDTVAGLLMDHHFQHLKLCSLLRLAAYTRYGLICRLMGAKHYEHRANSALGGHTPQQLILMVGKLLRESYPEIFIHYTAWEVMMARRQGLPGVVVSDMRQPNEYEVLTGFMSGVCVEVQRLEAKPAQPLDGLLVGLADVELNNNGTLDQLKGAVDQLAYRVNDIPSHMLKDWEYRLPEHLLGPYYTAQEWENFGTRLLNLARIILPTAEAMVEMLDQEHPRTA